MLRSEVACCGSLHCIANMHVHSDVDSLALALHRRDAYRASCPANTIRRRGVYLRVHRSLNALRVLSSKPESKPVRGVVRRARGDGPP